MQQWATDESGLAIFPGDDLEKIKASFIEFCILHNVDPAVVENGKLTPLQIARYAFKGCFEAEARALQAVQVWAQDIEILTAIRRGQSRGKVASKDRSETTKEDIEAVCYEVIENPFNSAKDKLAAAELLGRLNKKIYKDIDEKPVAGNAINTAEYFGNLAKLLPV